MIKVENSKEGLETEVNKSRCLAKQNFEITIIVFAILIALLAIADKMRSPKPVFLVVAGLSLGFIPSLPSFVLNPDVVFLLFLPPILYDAASHTTIQSSVLH